MNTNTSTISWAVTLNKQVGNLNQSINPWPQPFSKLPQRIAACVHPAPRRTAAIKRADSTFAEAIVEFRPHDSLSNSPDYSRRRWLIPRLAETFRAARRSRGTPIPCLPLVALADMKDTTMPCFCLVYDATGAIPLFESLPPAGPDVKQRHALALALARTVASLHIVGIVHGGINTDSLCLQCNTLLLGVRHRQDRC